MAVPENLQAYVVGFVLMGLFATFVREWLKPDVAVMVVHGDAAKRRSSSRSRPVIPFGENHRGERERNVGIGRANSRISASGVSPDHN